MPLTSITDSETKEASILCEKSHQVFYNEVDQIGKQIGVSQNDITSAVSRIAPYIHKTPIQTSRRMDAWLSPSSQTNFHFKLECLQRTGSFKFRGATNAISSLTEQCPSSKHDKIIVKTHSSGNHGQAVACAAQIFKIQANIVVPLRASVCKVQAIQEYGANIIRCESSSYARETTTEQLEGSLIHPYLDPRIVAGQATIGVELSEQFADADCIVVPIGGGGLISGIALSAKARMSNVKIVGAEPRLACGAAKSFEKGEQFVQKQGEPLGNTIADGVRSSIGKVGWHVARQLVEKVIVVEEDEIIESMKMIWMTMKLVVEPSAAVGVAACRKQEFRDIGFKKVAVILCGGNVDLDNLPWMSKC